MLENRLVTFEWMASIAFWPGPSSFTFRLHLLHVIYAPEKPRDINAPILVHNSWNVQRLASDQPLTGQTHRSRGIYRRSSDRFDSRPRRRDQRRTLGVAVIHKTPLLF